MTTTAHTAPPTQRCTRCGIGPFFLVPARQYPTLCLDCADLEGGAGDGPICQAVGCDSRNTRQVVVRGDGGYKFFCPAHEQPPAKRVHVSTPTADLIASRDEYRQHIEDQDLDAELLTFLAGVVDSIGVELLHRTREPWRTTTPQPELEQPAEPETIADFAFAVEVAASVALGKLFG